MKRTAFSSLCTRRLGASHLRKALHPSACVLAPAAPSVLPLISQCSFLHYAAKARSPLLAPMHAPSKVAPAGTAIAAKTNVATKSPVRGSASHGNVSTAGPRLSGGAGGSPVRTVSIVAHIDAGKTTTTERMLFYAGVLKRVGDVDAGTTTTDYMKEEMERGITIQSALVTLQWKDHSIYLLDTPGHADFTVEVERSVRVVDGVVALLDASAGVQAQSYTVLAQSIKYGVPVISFINKMDKSNADFWMSVRSIELKLKVEPLVLQLPLHGEAGELIGIMDLVKLQCYQFRGEHGEDVRIAPLLAPAEQEVSPEGRKPHESVSEADLQRALQHRHELISQLTAVDDALSEQFILALDETDGDEESAELRLPTEAIQAAIRRAVVCPPPASSNNSQREGRPRRFLVPVLCGAARRDFGVQPLLDAIVDYLPSPMERVVTGFNQLHAPVSMSPLPPALRSQRAVVSTEALMRCPLLALAFKVCHTTNPTTGKREPLVYIRVYSGVLRSAQAGFGQRVLLNRSKDVEEKVGPLYVLHANTPIEVKELRPGEVGALFLKKTYTGDTLYAPPMVVSGGHHHRPQGKEALRTPPPQTFRKTGTESEKRKEELVKEVATREQQSGKERDIEGSEEEEVFLLEGIDTPPPVLSYAIEAATPAQADELDTALAELLREDPSLSTHQDDYGHRVLHGLGELHLEIALSRLRHEYELDCRLLRAVVEYRETLTEPRCSEKVVVSHQGVPYAEITLSVQPLHHEEELKAVISKEEQPGKNDVSVDWDPERYESNATPQFCISSQALAGMVGTSSTSGAPPHLRLEEKKNLREWHRALGAGFQKSVDDACRMGPLAGMPMHGVLFTLHSFRRLGAGEASAAVSLPPDERVVSAVARNVLLPLLQGRNPNEEGALSETHSRTSASVSRTPSGTGILEPVMLVEIHLAEDGYVAEVIRCLNERQALWIDCVSQERTVLAHVAMRFLGKFSNELRAAVKGHASLSMQLHSYRLITDNTVQQQILQSRGCW